MQNDSAKPVAERFNYTGVGNAITRVVKEGESAKHPANFANPVCPSLK